MLPSDQPGTVDHAQSTLAQDPGLARVSQAIGVMNWSMEREAEGPRDPNAPKDLLPVIGVDGDPTRIPGMADITEGRWIRRPNEIVGSKLSRDEGMPLGSTVRLAGQSFTIVGTGKLRAWKAPSSRTAWSTWTTAPSASGRAWATWSASSSSSPATRRRRSSA